MKLRSQFSIPQQTSELEERDQTHPQNKQRKKQSSWIKHIQLKNNAGI